jgi:chromosome partitioning protein
VEVDRDPHCLATLKHYRSLMALAQEARKPMFQLRPADGAVGGHQTAVSDCYRDFEALARRIADRCGIALP